MIPDPRHNCSPRAWPIRIERLTGWIFHSYAPMTRKVTRKQKARGKQSIVNGHSVVIRVPHGELSATEIEANLRRLVADKHPYMLWNFTKFPRYVQVIAQCMGIRQERFPCCYGPQMPHSISKSVKAT